MTDECVYDYIHLHSPEVRDWQDVLLHNQAVLIQRLEACILAIQSLENRLLVVERAKPKR